MIATPRFLEPTDYRSFMDENEGHFGGIGAEIGQREVKKPDAVDVTAAPSTTLPVSVPGCGTDLTKAKQYQIVIVAPLPDSPAEKAGLHAGDRILKIGE